jgi:Glycine-zipper domain
VEHEVSLYYIANEIATTYTGMMIAIPEPEWAIFTVMLVLVVGLSGCAEMSGTERSTLTGGAAGAAGGALIGAMAGNAGMGAAIGAGVGVVGGFLYGKHKESEQNAYQQGYQQGQQSRYRCSGLLLES